MALLEGGGIFEGYRDDSEEVGCFYCQEARDEKGRTPVIMWMGGPSKVNGTTTIYLHHDCAMDLCLRILRDVHESQCRGYDRNGIW
jgi:hypothetical protein